MTHYGFSFILTARARRDLASCDYALKMEVSGSERLIPAAFGTRFRVSLTGLGLT
jgi:hypothetical protein